MSHFFLRCALLDKSIKLCLQGFVSMLISKSVRTTMLFQWLFLRNVKFKMADMGLSLNKFLTCNLAPFDYHDLVSFYVSLASRNP